MASEGLRDGEGRDRDTVQQPIGGSAYQPAHPMSALLIADAKSVAGIVSPSNAAPAPAHTPAPSHEGSRNPVSATSGTRDSENTPTVQQPLPGIESTDVGDNTTYGTRSRNRGGNSRVNYAEDQEMDFDFLASTAGKKRPAAEQLIMPDAERMLPAPRLAAGSSKESTPLAANGHATTSKKRKAGGPVPQNTHAHTPPIPGSAVPATTARKPITAGSVPAARETNVMTFYKHKNTLNKKGELTADDGTKLAVNDHVYLVCEPPGDPYYLCRVMEFLHVNNDDPNSPIDAIRVNWYYRPRDVQRFNSDTRLLYGTMHSDICPLASLRGKCIIKHRSEIEDLEAYRKERDSFYFVQVFDRFIRRWYECIPVAQIINVPEKVKKALDERWKFVVVEVSRVKELTSAVKTCKRCTRFCASQDSVDCAICKNSYHMNCVQPPLPKKPSRGFAWACGPCSRASERKLESRNTPTVSGDVTEAEEEVVEEEEQPIVADESARAPSPVGDETASNVRPVTAAEVALAKMWPMRYLGVHCRVEDALQYDDRAIYPRASSRLGPRHQATTGAWYGTVELVKPAEIKKRYNKAPAGKKEGKMTKETIAALEADREAKARRPKHVQDEPPGYVARGEDYPEDDPRCTAKLISRMPQLPLTPDQKDMVDDYVKNAKYLSRAIGVPPFGVNFLDKAVELYTKYNWDKKAALKKLETMDRKKDIHEPILTKQELAKFEEGVAKYGSEHRQIRLHMKTQLPNADIVRFYYLWKKTPKGREVWGNYGGRKGSKRKLETDTGARALAEVSNDGDDSAFDNDKAARVSRGFRCKFCSTTHARQWRKAPGVTAGQLVPIDAKNGGKDKNNRPMLALCLRCAGLWRKYSIQWEDAEEVQKKVAQAGGRALKRRVDEELLHELRLANEAASRLEQEPAPPLQSIEGIGEPPKKKTKTDAAVLPPELPKKKERPPPPLKEPTPPPPPIVPTPPTWKELACAVCDRQERTISCAHCKLTVHRSCFGVLDNDGIRPDGSVHWVCEQCQNDRYPEVSTDYTCCLCTTEETLIDLVEPPKVSHKKKTDREREKERMEKELADLMRMEYRNKQFMLNRPLFPREPLKKTSGNNWAHIHCSVWMPELRYSNAQKLEVAEGFPAIPVAKYNAVCKFCKNKDHDGKVKEDAGACVSCFQCSASFHASCAFKFGCQFGFDVTPVKGSRKDQVITAKLGEENGFVQAAIWCKDHSVKSIVHSMDEIVDGKEKTALQLFVETYKQADLTLTGTVRKANMVQLTKDKSLQYAQAVAANSRRESGTGSIAAAVRRGARNSSVAEAKSAATAEESSAQNLDVASAESERRCAKCKIDVTPRWHTLIRSPPLTPPKSPVPRRLSMTLGEYTAMQRDRSSKERDSPPKPDSAGVDAVTSPVNGPPPFERQRPQQNIRFMAPGANGRAWDGMPDRYGPLPPPQPNGDARLGEYSAVQKVEPMHEHVPAVENGDRPLQEMSNGDGVFHTSGLPQYQNPAEPTPPVDGMELEPEKSVEFVSDYLCHKCFIKKKTDPTPSPKPQPAEPAVVSPSRQFPIQLEWNRAPASSSQPPRDAPVRMPWDETLIPAPPAPPHMNGNGHVPPSGIYGPPQPSMIQGSGYPPYGQQPNGYHQPPPPQHHGPPPSHMHQRQPSYGYGPSVQGPSPLGYGQQRPSPMQGYPPASGPMPNGVHHPAHGPSAPLQSPTLYAGPPPQPYYQAPRRTESPFSSQLPPLGQPLHTSPQNAFARPDMPGPPPMQQGPHLGHMGPHQQYGSQPPGPFVQQQPPPPSHLHQQPNTQQAPPQSNVQIQGLNSVAPAGPPQESVQQQQQPVGQPNAPNGAATDTQPGQGGQGVSNGEQASGLNGASASPSLRNLLH
ncbi:hypothetical protein LTR62_006530 [Meristemomyces frigidus]|uniref:Uncharacterized protein n=1 Tax=Meristemomyces frigidus TaxID=1508187 RepID=A0AAN7YIF9_9PEZI|nr:hypothetical protein LTR62_006530 [Meristemomyces frigidus]